jgi:hypothetical protein
MWECTGRGVETKCENETEGSIKMACHGSWSGCHDLSHAPFVITQCFVRSFILVDDEIVWATIYQITVYVVWLASFLISNCIWGHK